MLLLQTRNTWSVIEKITFGSTLTTALERRRVIFSSTAYKRSVKQEMQYLGELLRIYGIPWKIKKIKRAKTTG